MEIRHYEGAMQATNADACRLHIYGAAKMFELTNPKQCTEGVLCQIFFHIRTQMTFAQLTSRRREAPVDVKKILYNTLTYEELPVFKRLVTHFTRLTDAYSELNGSPEQRHLEIAEVMIISSAVSELWDEYESTAFIINESLTWRDTATNTTRYRDAFTALVTSYFSATRILLFIVAPPLAASDLDPAKHYQSILDVASYMKTHLIACAYMRMAAPLLFVALHAPNIDQRQRAFEYFMRW